MKLSHLIIIFLVGVIVFKTVNDNARREEEQKAAKLQAAIMERKRIELEQLAFRAQEEQLRREQAAQEALARARMTPPPTPKPDWRWTSDPIRGIHAD